MHERQARTFEKSGDEQGSMHGVSPFFDSAQAPSGVARASKFKLKFHESGCLYFFSLLVFLSFFFSSEFMSRQFGQSNVR